MARARTVREHPINVLAEIEHLTGRDERVLRLLAEHEVMSTEQLTALCFEGPRVALARLNYLATRALLVKFEHPGIHPAGFPADAPDTEPARPGADRGGWHGGRRPVWSLGQGGAYWAGVERVLSRHAWVEAWSRSFVPQQRPHLRRRLVLNDFFTALHQSSHTRPGSVLDQWWGPQRCADASGGRLTPDGHGRWRHRGVTVPFWIYSDYFRDPFRNLITTTQRHHAVHARTAEGDVILLVMVNDNREALLHRRWAAHTATGAPVPRVATTSYRKLRAWPTDAIWWPIGAAYGDAGQAWHLHQFARPAAALDGAGGPR